MRLFQSLLVLLVHLFVNRSTAEGEKHPVSDCRAQRLHYTEHANCHKSYTICCVLEVVYAGRATCLLSLHVQHKKSNKAFDLSYDNNYYDISLLLF